MVTIDLEKLDMSAKDLIAMLNGETEILVTMGDKPVAKIEPVVVSDESSADEQHPMRRMFNLHPNAIAYIRDDFDDPLPDEFWLGSDDDPLYQTTGKDEV